MAYTSCATCPMLVIRTYRKRDLHRWMMGGGWYRIVIPLIVQDDGSPCSVLMSQNHLD